MQDNELFLKYVADNYSYLQKKMKSWAFNTHRTFDEDVFQTTILKIYDLITKNGKAKDNSDYGFECLFFRAFSLNTDREQQYAVNKLRDLNVMPEDINPLYENYVNENAITQDEKVLKDLFLDFSTSYILNKLEENFNSVDFHLYRIKLYYQCTYKKLKELTKVKDCKQRIVKMNEWIKSNITKQEIQSKFEEYCENIE